jgi:hypothetical protein
MATYDAAPGTEENVSGWAIGAITFAACMLSIIGFFQIIAGITAIADDQFFVVTQNYTFDLDTTVWGWLHLLLGIAMAATGFGLFSRATWAGVTAIMLVSLSMVFNFFFIPYYPFWAILVIALDAWVLWALTRPGAIKT